MSRGVAWCSGSPGAKGPGYDLPALPGLTFVPSTAHGGKGTAGGEAGEGVLPAVALSRSRAGAGVGGRFAGLLLSIGLMLDRYLDRTQRAAGQEDDDDGRQRGQSDEHK